MVMSHVERDGRLLSSSLESGPWSVDVVNDPDAAITALFDGHYTRMLRVAVVLLGDRAAAEDVVQDAFLALHSGWTRIRDKPEAVGYLHRSVVNGARSRLRRRAVALRLRPPRLPDTISAEDAALAAQVSGPLLAAMRALPRREREAVLFRHYLDLSEQQTADALGLRPGSVKGYASRGLAKLRTALNASIDVQEQS
jgi:RNA polymerase sigma-70 factor (sigma-E family)